MILIAQRAAMPHALLEGRKAGTKIQFDALPTSIDMFSISGTPYLININSLNDLIDRGYLAV